MDHTFRTSRRFFVPGLIALALAAQASGSTLALDRDDTPRRVVASPAAPTTPTWGRTLARLEPDVPPLSRRFEPIVDWAVRPGERADAALAARRGAVRATPAAAAAVQSTVAAPTPSRSGYRGANHVWIPSLGISRAVEFFPCSRTKPPGHRMYRWGCAGTNNVYLFAHAATVFKPLHDAYVRGRLRTGLEVVYADGAGRVSRYAVSYWKVVRPDGDIAWAYAAQARPSMTLQTCVGANSAYRLVVRLVRSR